MAVGLAAGTQRLGSLTTENRVLLTRARWAAEGCIGIAMARYAEGALPDADSVNLGGGTWCGWRVTDPTSRLNVNTSDGATLERLLSLAGIAGDSVRSFVGAVLARRPFRDVAHLERLPGAAALGSPFLPFPLFERITVDGPGTINANGASLEVLAVVAGLGREAADLLAARRSMGRPVRDIGQLLEGLPPYARAQLEAHEVSLRRMVTFVPAQLIMHVEGRVERGGAVAPIARIELQAVPHSGRLAVVRRRMAT
jgi:hypothetical protein